jgi:hypothetical protein
MKYACLFYIEETAFDPLSAVEKKQLDTDSTNFDADLEARGILIAAQALQPTHTATMVSVRNGKTVVTDGPFAETKEHLGGLILCEARDLNEAIAIAAGMPVAKLGRIEVRPAMVRHLT